MNGPKTQLDVAVDECVELFDKFHHAVRETNRRAEKLQAAEVEFLNAVDEQRAVFDDAMAAFERKQALEWLALNRTEVPR